MIYTLFFSRLRDLPPAQADEYRQRASTLRALAEAGHPGFLGMKTYVAEDGERLTVVRFEDEASQRGWKRDPAHREAQTKGRTNYYEHYRIVVCEELHTHGFERGGGEGG